LITQHILVKLFDILDLLLLDDLTNPRVLLVLLGLYDALNVGLGDRGAGVLVLEGPLPVPGHLFDPE